MAHVGSAKPARRRVGFSLGGDETPVEGEDAVLNGDSSTILDDDEQDEIVKQLSALSEQSSLLWRISALVLDALCFVVYAFVPLPYVFALHSTPLSYFYRRSLLLLELFLGTLSALTEFVTTLPEPSTPTRQLPHYRYTLSLKEKLHHMLRLPPEVSSSATDIARLRLSAPLLAATILAGIRTCANIWLYFRGSMNAPDAFVYSASFFFLFVSILARSYAKELDRDIGELQRLKYANKGA